MRLVRFLKQSFAMNRLIQAGEELLVHDDFPLAPHIIDIAAESRGEAPMEPDQRDPNAGVFRSELSHNLEAAGGPFARDDAHPAVLASVAAAQERQKQAEEQARQEAEAAEAKRQADEAEAKRLADEAEAKRLADEAEKQRQNDEAEAKRLQDEADARRKADEAAAQHQSDNPDPNHPGSQGSSGFTSTAGE